MICRTKTAVEQASAADIESVALAMRHADFIEFAAVSHAATRHDIARALVARFAGNPDVLVGRSGAPICIGGVIYARPNVATLLFFATDNFPVIALPITRFIRNRLFPRLEAAGVHRFEAVSMVGHSHAHRWLSAIGLKQETPPLRGYGKNGESFVQFSRVS